MIRTALLTAILSSQAIAIGSLIKIQENGPRSNRVNVVIVGDGYTSSDSAKFITDLGKFKTAMLSDPTLNRYASYHNFYGVFVASNQSGADADNIKTDANCSDGTAKSNKDTYFGSYYCASNIQRLLVANSSLAQSTAKSLIPEAQVVAVLVNSSVYGGSGGSIAVANSGAPEIIAHEIGHSYVGLADEYDYTAGYTPSEKINATAISDRTNIRWKDWILPSTPMPTPETNTYNSVVGAFEGANYQATGWYRPMLNCRMKSNGVNLCSVCAEAWTLRIYKDLRLFDTWTPNTNLLQWNSQTSVQFSPLHPYTGSPLSYEWWLDGIKTKITDTIFKETLNPGSHTLKAIAFDPSPSVKNDPSGLLKDTLTWQINASNLSSTSSSSSSSNQTTITHEGNQAGLALVNYNTQGFELHSLYSANQVRILDPNGSILQSTQTQGQVFQKWPKPLPAGTYILEVQNSQQHNRWIIPLR